METLIQAQADLIAALRRDRDYHRRCWLLALNLPTTPAA